MAKKKPVKKPLSDAETKFLRAALDMVPIIHSDVLALFRDSGERVTQAKLIAALAEGAIEQADFKEGVNYPQGADYATLEKSLRLMIRRNYF